MQFLEITPTMTLSELADLVGDRNVDYILNANGLSRTPNVGRDFVSLCDKGISETGSIDWVKKSALLNTLTGSYDMFQKLALASEDEWKLFANKGTLPGLLKIPDTVTLPDSVQVWGESSGISTLIYKKAMDGLKSDSHAVDPGIFNEYSNMKPSQIIDRRSTATTNTSFNGFKIPWGDITLHSSLYDETVDVPVYPEELSDGVSATYGTMPDTIYQYEPWYVYESSGPRKNSYTFKFHRDMWSGDHTDGRANDLIRFCEANCYPEYNGSAVATSIFSIYIKGNLLISGVLTDVHVNWSGPIGSDGWYLYCEMELSITEVSKDALSYTTVRNKSLIG